MRRTAPAVFAFALFLLAAPVLAATPDAKTAEELKGLVKESLSWYTDAAKAAGMDTGFAYEGDISVMPGPEFYTITIPAASLGVADGFRMVIGDILVNAKESGAEKGAWAFSVALPPEMKIEDAAGKAAADLTIGSQRFSALWLPSLDTMSKYDIEYGDIALKPRGNTPLSFSIGRLAYIMNFVSSGDGTMSGPLNMTLEKAAFVLKGSGAGSVGVSLDRAASSSEYQRVPLVSVRAARDRVRALVAANDPGLTDEQMQAKIMQIARETYSLPEDYTSRYEVAGLALEILPDKPPGADGKGGPIEARLSTLSGRTVLSGLKAQSGGIYGTSHLDSLKVTGLPEPLGGLVPETFNTDLRFTNLPMQALAKVFSDVMLAATQNALNPGQKQAAALNIQETLKGLPRQLAAAGAAFEVKDTRHKSRDLSSTLEGRLAASASSPLLAAGTVTFTLKGLDELIVKYRNMAGSDPGIAPYLQTLTVMQLAGELGKQPDGSSLRTYRLELTPDGRMLLNGADLSALRMLVAPAMGGGMSFPAAPSPPAPTTDVKPLQ